MVTADQETARVLELFFDEAPSKIEVRNTSHGEEDFREAILAEWVSGEKYVIKLAYNDFTFAEKIEAWKRCAEEYLKLGYYCPRILHSKNGNFPTVRYKGYDCVVYAEEYSKYRSAEDFGPDAASDYMDDAFAMTAKVAAAKFDYTDYPSGYCLFERFCPSDDTDEVMANALEWKTYADTLPSDFQNQVTRIWQRWIENREALERIYRDLPTSVFQADLNTGNILLDDNGKFVGVLDFNLCGKDVFLNYLLREIRGTDEEYELNSILCILKKIRGIYRFSDLEKETALQLYRCIKPLWFTRVQALKAAGSEIKAIRECLDRTEFVQTREIDFASCMSD